MKNIYTLKNFLFYFIKLFPPQAIHFNSKLENTCHDQAGLHYE